MVSRRSVMKIALPILVLVGAVVLAGYLQATKPGLEATEPEERSWLISSVTVQIRDVTPNLTAFGEVTTARDVDMRALVAGPVVDVGPAFVDGGVVREKDLLVQIDPFDYDAAVAEQTAALLEAEAERAETNAELAAERAALEEARTQLAIAERELERQRDLVARGVVSEKRVDDAALARSERMRASALAENRVEMIRARARRQTAAIKRAGVGLQRAERDLKNTSLIAPFDGYLTETSAAVGKRLGVNDRVARLLDLKRLEVRFHLSDAEYGRLVASKNGLIGRRVDIVWRAGRQQFAYKGTVARIGGEIDPASGGVTVYARIDGVGHGTPLRPGAFVEVGVPDRTYAQVARLPETALIGGDTVYVVVEERLKPRLVELLARIDNDVIVAGELADGEEVATTRFPGIGPGVKVRVR